MSIEGGIVVGIEILRSATKRLLRMHFEAGVGHIGGNLSVLPILLEIFHDVKLPDESVVLSKGHAAGALYVSLWTKGLLSDADLGTFHKDSTLLAGHPPATGLPEVPFATGSLGHGLALANGLALAERLRGTSRRVFCVTSDGEWNEGSMWESLVFAAHQKLGNLCLIVDRNGLQGFGRTSEVADLEPLEQRFSAFQCDVHRVNAVEYGSLQPILREYSSDRPRVVIANTVKGRGISFMQNRMEWHYLPMSREQYDQALLEVCNG